MEIAVEDIVAVVEKVVVDTEKYKIFKLKSPKRYYLMIHIPTGNHKLGRSITDMRGLMEEGWTGSDPKFQRLWGRTNPSIKVRKTDFSYRSE